MYLAFMKSKYNSNYYCILNSDVSDKQTYRFGLFHDNNYII